MTTLFLLILLLITLLLLCFRFFKTSIVLLGLTIIFYLLNGCGVIPYFLLRSLETTPPLATPVFGKKNVFVLLGAGIIKQNNTVVPSIVAYSRIVETARLYSLCKKSKKICTIIISGGDPTHSGTSEAEVYQTVLVSLGIQSSDIILEKNSSNTFKNAEFTHDILSTLHFDQFFLITSGIHINRSLLYFSNFKLYPTPAPSDYLTVIFSPIPIGYNFAMSDFAMHEYVGVLRFYWYNFMGWNKK